ncbi:hypothetical protein ACFWAN_03040 [Streptomyces mirabilis]|uniref:hypothetical protein n=1 Tax=Streptomyces mirabilis TaxID=68239 RepID=UPI0036482D04
MTNYQPMAASVVAVCGVVGLVVQARRTRNVMDDAKRDLEVLALLPVTSGQRAALQQSIEDAVARYLADRRDKSRDPSGIVIALFLAATGAFLWWLAASNGGYWWWCAAVALPSSLFGVFGFVESVTLAQRDAKGNKIRVVEDGVAEGETP